MTEKEKYEKELTDLAYKVALRLYNTYYSSVKSLNIEKDDWLQEAVMYIVLKYGKYSRENIKKTIQAEPENAEGIVYRYLKKLLLNRFQINFRKIKAPKSKETKAKETKTKKRVSEERPDRFVSLDEELPGDFQGSKLDLMQDTTNYNPSEIEEMLEGKEIFESFLDYFDKEPYKTFKHTYVGKSKLLGKDAPLSEYNIAKLIMNGKVLDEILKIYGVYTDNIGSSSVATFVNRKVKEVINMLSDALNSLPAYERKIVKAYINSIQ
jgi:hypothetical protein